MSSNLGRPHLVRHHSQKWHDCWIDVQAKGHTKHEAAAICTAALGEDSYDGPAELVQGPAPAGQAVDGADDPAVLVDAVEAALRGALAPVVGRLRALEMTSAEVAPALERIAVLEAAAPVPGPPGPMGEPGLGFDDFRVEYDGERTIMFAWARGEHRVAERAFALPAMLYRGVYVPDKWYERGDVVTWDGSLWHANADTQARPGDGARDWTLAVKRGRDGKR